MFRRTVFLIVQPNLCSDTLIRESTFRSLLRLVQLVFKEDLEHASILVARTEAQPGGPIRNDSHTEKKE